MLDVQGDIVFSVCVLFCWKLVHDATTVRSPQPKRAQHQHPEFDGGALYYLRQLLL